MPSIISGTEVDSPVIDVAVCHDDKYPKVCDDGCTLLADPSSGAVKERIVTEVFVPPFYPLWTRVAAKQAKKSPAANSETISASQLRDCTLSASRKRGSTIFDVPCGLSNVVDPANLLLAKKIHHDELMELHERLKKSQDVAKPARCAKKIITRHGLAPFGMSIPELGNAYVTAGAGAVKEPLVESNLELYNRFQVEEVEAKKKKGKKEVKKLKKDGKVRTLAPFMFS
jgi:hypothetical protein